MFGVSCNGIANGVLNYYLTIYPDFVGAFHSSDVHNGAKYAVKPSIPLTFPAIEVHDRSVENLELCSWVLFGDCSLGHQTLGRAPCDAGVDDCMSDEVTSVRRTDGKFRWTQ